MTILTALVVGVTGGLLGAWLHELCGGMSTKEFVRLLGLGRSSEKACGVEEDPGSHRLRLMVDYYAAGSLLIGEEPDDEEIAQRARTAMREHGYEERFNDVGVPIWAASLFDEQTDGARRG